MKGTLHNNGLKYVFISDRRIIRHQNVDGGISYILKVKNSKTRTCKLQQSLKIMWGPLKFNTWKKYVCQLREEW